MSFVQNLRHQKWLTFLVLLVLLVSTLSGFYAAWGVLFIFWGLLAMRSGQAFLVEPIERFENPAVFWLLVVLWIGLGILYVVADFFPHLMTGF